MSIIQTSTPKTNIGTSKGNDSVYDAMIKNERIDTKYRDIKNNKDIYKDVAKNKVEQAGAESIRNIALGQGASNNTADQIVNVAKYGKKAKDSLVALGAKGLDNVLGTNISGLVQDFFPELLPNNLDHSNPNWGKAPANSIAAKMELRGDPLLNFHWGINLPRLPNLTGFDFDTFNFHVEEANITLPYFDSEPVFRNGTVIFYPKFSNSGSISLTLFENDAMAGTAYFQAWKNLIQNPKGYYNRPSIYKRPIMLHPYDNANIRSGTFYIKSAWPTNVTITPFTSANSDYQKLTVEFGLNRIYFLPNEQRAQQISAIKRNNSRNNSPGVKAGDLSDLIQNPVEFAKQVLGFKSKTNIRF